MPMPSAKKMSSDPDVFNNIATSYDNDTAQFNRNMAGKSKSTTPLKLDMNAVYDAGNGMLKVLRKLPAIWQNATNIFNFIWTESIMRRHLVSSAFNARADALLDPCRFRLFLSTTNKIATPPTPPTPAMHTPKNTRKDGFNAKLAPLQGAHTPPGPGAYPSMHDEHNRPMWPWVQLLLPMHTSVAPDQQE